MSEILPQNPEALADNTQGESPDYAFYVGTITMYEKEAQEWEEKVRKILRRYKDQRSPREENLSRYNIYWSGLQTQIPATFARNPKPDIERRFKDEDDLGRITSMVLERTTTYFVNTTDFHSTMRAGVFDLYTASRGVAWVRYEPHFRDVAVQGNEEEKEQGEEITDTVYAGDAEGSDDYEKVQEIAHENVCYDHVNFQDFGHNVARNWKEVSIVWRIVYMERSKLKKRFGDEIGGKIPLNYTPKGLNDEKIPQYLKKAAIYEIWDKDEKKALWLSKDYPDIIEEREDPLKLPDFFPCPEPLYPQMVGDKLIPVPEYIQFQDQLDELDRITSRIEGITKAIKVAGVYAGGAEGVERLMVEGEENVLIPIDQWMAFAEKGGLKGVMEFLPMQEIVQTLLALYEARDKVKQDLYEITGMSDIMRGATDPDETAEAQKIKGSFGCIRLKDKQAEAQRFSRDLVRLTAQIIAKHFSIETIKKICGVKLLTMAEKQQIQMQLQQQAMMAQHAAMQQQQQGAPGQPPAPPQQPPQPPQLPEKLQEMMKNPTWEEVQQLLRDDADFGFKIEIETDSTIAMDEEADRDARMQFIEAGGTMIEKAMQINNPTLMPLIAEMLMFGVRSFKAGRPLETAFEVAIDKLQKQADNPQANQQNPAMAKVQGEIAVQKAKQQAEVQATQQEMQMRAHLDQQKMQMEAEASKQRSTQELQNNQQEAATKLQLERERMQMELAMKERQMQLELALKEKLETMKIKEMSKQNVVSQRAS